MEGLLAKVDLIPCFFSFDIDLEIFVAFFLSKK